MTQWLIRQWYSDSAPLFLRPLAWIYSITIATRRWAYQRGLLRSHKVERPVLVVGNLTVGGTGKTPLVIWLAQQLIAKGYQPGVLARGYGRDDSTPRWVELNSSWREVGDEPLLIRHATQCLTAVAADRVVGAKMLIERGATVVICDDGLQHLRLARDCEVIVIDGMRGFGNGRLLPAGPLREPLSRLASADALVTNGGNVQRASFEMTLVPEQPVPLGAQSDATLGKKVHAVAGIGNPQRFFQTLRNLGFEPIEHPFPDHHAFTAGDLRFDDDLPVLMTAKDAVKCRDFADSRLWYLPIKAHFAESQARWLLERVFRKLGLDSKG